MAARVGVLEGDLADAPALPTDLDAVVHCAGDVSLRPAGRRGLPHQRRRAPASCWPGSARPARTSTTCTSPRRTSRGAAAAASPRARSTAESSTSRPSWPGGLGQRRPSSTARAAPRCSRAERKKAEKEHSRAGLLTARRRDRGGPQGSGSRTSWCGSAPSGPAASAGPTATPSPRRSASASSRSTPAPTGSPSCARASSSPRSQRPYPGWIEGFKMAEPLILAYGRGELPEFPAAADTIVDIVPVDHVVAAIVAVLAHPPEVGEPAYFHVSSGDRNPLTFRTLYENVRAYFDAHPFRSGDRGATRLPEWRFPGARSPSSGCSAPSERALQGRRLRDRPRAAQRPDARPGPQARPAGPAAGVPAPLPRPLPGVHPGRAALLRRATPSRSTARCPTQDQATFAFDTAVIDWEVYLSDIHCPAVTAPIRRLDEVRAARSRRRPRPAPKRARSRSPASPRSSTWTARCCPPTSSRPTCGCGCSELSGTERLAELGRIAAQGAGAGAGRAPRAQRVPALGLPRVRRRAARRPRRDRRRAR